MSEADARERALVYAEKQGLDERTAYARGYLRWFQAGYAAGAADREQAKAAGAAEERARIMALLHELGSNGGWAQQGPHSFADQLEADAASATDTLSDAELRGLAQEGVSAEDQERELRRRLPFVRPGGPLIRSAPATDATHDEGPCRGSWANCGEPCSSPPCRFVTHDETPLT